MRLATAIVVLACPCWAQFKSTVPLVVAPTTVTDSKGHFVDGLTTDDLILYDNNVPQKIQMDWMTYPIDLVVAVQTSANSGAVIDKLGGSGILFSQLLAADAGETAVISFSDDVKVHQDFTSNPDLVIHSLRMLRKEGDNAHMLDAMHQALADAGTPPARTPANHPHDRRKARPFEQRKAARSHGAGGAAQCRGLLADLFAIPGAVHGEAQDRRGSETRGRAHQGPEVRALPAPDDTAVPPDLGPGGYVYAIHELIRLHKPDLSSLFTKTTGGRTLSFLKKSALEQAIQLVGEEVHRQYILSFEPKGGEPGHFTRSGSW